MPLNLHKIANKVLSPVQKQESIEFVRTYVSYNKDSFEPVKEEEIVKTTACIQPYIPFQGNQIVERGARTTMGNEYYLVFITGETRMLNQAYGVNSDVFYARGKKYVVTSPSNWENQMWTQAICRQEADDRNAS